MTTGLQKHCRWCLALLMAMPPGTTFAGSPFAWGSKKVRTNTERLAVEIDALECALNNQGTVVAKAPDIWGEARLTAHRHEFEKKLAGELDNFKETFNASFRASDQAFLGAALAISTNTPTASEFTLLNNLAVGQAVSSDPPAPGAAVTTPIVRTTPGSLFVSNSQLPGFGSPQLQVEPTIRLDQLKRYLNHLQEIRRINEGDDTSDTPGYSLNLVRIPISVIPGDATRKGYGAEVTVTATPHITRELLPTVYRRLVVNDIVDQWHVAVSQLGMTLLELELRREHISSTSLAPQSAPVPVNVNPAEANATTVLKGKTVSYAPPAVFKTPFELDDGTQTPNPPQVDLTDSRSVGVAISAAARRTRLPVSSSQFVETFGRGLVSVSLDFYNRAKISSPTTDFTEESPKSAHAKSRLYPLDARSYLKDEVEAAYDYLNTQQNVSLWACVPQIVEAVRNNDVPALRDLRTAVVRRRNYTYNNKNNEPQWRNFDNPPSGKNDDFRETPTSTLAWAVLVHSALLNEELNNDVKRVSQDPNCQCLPADCPLAFYGPDPLDDARNAFIEYVKCRWPVHVFALDPDTQDQNVIDTFALRRELQLAFALSIAAGKLSPGSPAIQNLERYARRLELDIETVSLNRTAVAFSHGEDTFGWRFYPRVQTPSFQGNATVAFRDLLAGGPSKDALRGQWELEPAQRECTAIVVMPSFIDHMRFDVRGNFFKLRSPDTTKASILYDVKWSERVQSMRHCAEAVVHESHMYRDGEVDRLLKRVHQLEKRLPLQTVHSKVPNENTFGGFEMFASGTSDLAPEVYGFYGEPGIDPSKDTEVFLHGENFSIHGTRVIAGNKSCDFDLLSRQVMRVTIPAGVRTESGEFVDVHLATPYGVTRHLEIPVATSPVPAAPGYTMATREMPVQFGYTVDPATKVPTMKQTRVRKPHTLAITAPPNVRTPEKLTINFALRAAKDDIVQQIATISVADVVLDPDTRSYIIEGAPFVTLMTSVRTALVTAKLHDANGTFAPIDLELSANVGSLSDRVTGSLHLATTFVLLAN